MTANKPPPVRQNFLTPETCFSLLAQYHTAVLRGELSPPKRKTTAVPLRDVAARVRLPQCCGVPDLDLRVLRDNVVTLMSREWGFPGLLPDFTAYTTVAKGGAHELHADNSKPDGSPNHTSWRAATGILYLNTGGTDFAGGEIVFPQFGLTITPKPGLLVSFPCGWEYRHQVPAVTRGERHSIAFWTTLDRAREERWPAPANSPPAKSVSGT